MSWLYGVTSRVPQSVNHYLLFDVDEKASRFYEWVLSKKLHRFPNFSYSTPNGCHCIVLRVDSFRGTAKTLRQCPYVDGTWVSIGVKRGYWFLHTWTPPPFFFLERMVLMKIGKA